MANTARVCGCIATVESMVAFQELSKGDRVSWSGHVGHTTHLLGLLSYGGTKCSASYKFKGGGD